MYRSSYCTTVYYRNVLVVHTSYFRPSVYYDTCHLGSVQDLKEDRVINCNDIPLPTEHSTIFNQKKRRKQE